MHHIIPGFCQILLNPLSMTNYRKSEILQPALIILIDFSMYNILVWVWEAIMNTCKPG